MLARIYRPARTATQSGLARSQHWVLEYQPEHARSIDPLMGWTSSGDMRAQIRLTFTSAEEAIAYARSQGIPYVIKAPHGRQFRIRDAGYGANFSFRRREGWTH